MQKLSAQSEAVLKAVRSMVRAESELAFAEFMIALTGANDKLSVQDCYEALMRFTTAVAAMESLDAISRKTETTSDDETDD